MCWIGTKKGWCKFNKINTREFIYKRKRGREAHKKGHQYSPKLFWYGDKKLSRDKCDEDENGHCGCSVPLCSKGRWKWKRR